MRSTKSLLFTVSNLGVILPPPASSSVSSQFLTLLISSPKVSVLRSLSPPWSGPLMSSPDYGGGSLTGLPASSLCIPFTVCTGTSVSFQEQSSFFRYIPSQSTSCCAHSAQNKAQVHGQGAPDPSQSGVFVIHYSPSLLSHCRASRMSHAAFLYFKASLDSLDQE